ncbi:flagellar basal body-associated protein FliL [Marinobacter koreensis]|jgi:flagellar FliL protein|uniref:Flagellar protein FliL n=1 Tax=Marinobacter koreensis TaxID=335974 RepID=A0ABW0RHW0_9GAMM|nr:flagellar basal body-associated FliL family protein [Marinobacter koreensis]MCK7547079.1 flagellar basal body-associated FliL family protein [Marinobacter koreensis]MDX1818693.1 flagellar basal body-associated FliL family protein [Marinobacter sp.]
MAENTASDGAPAKKGKLKLIILITVVLILAIGLSVAGTLWFLGDGLPGSDSEESAPAEEAFVPSSYVDIEKPLVTTVQAEGRQRYAQVFVSLSATDPEALAAAELHMPLIRSQLVMVLSSSQFMELQTPEGRRGLAEKMLATVNQVLEQEGKPAIDGVLFRNFVVQ